MIDLRSNTHGCELIIYRHGLGGVFQTMDFDL